MAGAGARLSEPAMARKTYLENFHRHEKELEGTCAALGVDYQRFVTDEAVIEGLTRFLRRRI